MTSTSTDRTRTPLSRERVLDGAIGLVDRIGIEPFTIRKLAAELDVKPMTIYHHVAGKDAILDGIVDLVFAEIDLPPTDTDWRTAIRRRCLSARDVLARHPWAPPLMESRTLARARRRCATTTRCSAACGAAASRGRSRRTPTRSWTASSTGSRSRRRACRSTATRRSATSPSRSSTARRRRVPQPRRVHDRARAAARLRLRQLVRVRPRPASRRHRRSRRICPRSWRQMTSRRTSAGPGGITRTG